MPDQPAVLNQPVDVSGAFLEFGNEFFLPGRVTAFNPQRGEGAVRWQRHRLEPLVDFAHAGLALQPAAPRGFRGGVYGDETLPFAVSFPSARTVRFRISAHGALREEPSLMLARPLRDDRSWTTRTTKTGAVYAGPHGSVEIALDPWRITVRDAAGAVLTHTRHLADTGCFMNHDPMPFCFVRQGGDFARRIAATFTLAPDEKLFGCGESFTRLDKRGQKIVLWAHDAQGVQSQRMYKPIPFFLSSRGYGMFVHASTPMTFDFGSRYDESNTLYVGDDQLDLFIFLGDPKDVLGAYTALTGRSPLPPLWSFGLWMSRITYDSQRQAEAVAAGLRRHRIPADVIHLDTGWFERDWECDYRFAKARFPNASRMIAKLKRAGLRICLWQLPYFIRTNALFPGIIRKRLAVTDGDGRPETQEAVLDFSNSRTIRWYQDKIARLLRQGVAAIKVDFGEGAPLHGRYASGRSGFHEHNLYPLRYNRAAAEVTRRVKGNGFIWARSAWAGSQRYPVHWGGDAENTDSAMAATLRGGLSFGLSGFAFWSHDIGGFVKRTPEDLYARWLPFGMLTSHSRCHGAPPKEPWEYGPAFTNLFRTTVELKYRLMPYVLAQARDCSDRGLPMVRALFIEYPDDPGSWLIEDQYLFGRDLLVAPLFTSARSRRVYLPPGAWVDDETGRIWTGPGWHDLAAGGLPVILLIRGGALIPRVAPAPSTDAIDWRTLAWTAYGDGAAEGLVCLPDDLRLRRVRIDGDGTARGDPPPRGRRWTVRRR